MHRHLRDTVDLQTVEPADHSLARQPQHQRSQLRVLRHEHGLRAVEERRHPAHLHQPQPPSLAKPVRDGTGHVRDGCLAGEEHSDQGACVVPSAGGLLQRAQQPGHQPTGQQRNHQSADIGQLRPRDATDRPFDVVEMPPFTRRSFLASSALAASPLLKAAPPAPAGAPWPRYVNSIPVSLRIPEKHPYLTLTPETIAHAKQRAEGTPWAKQQLDRMFADADGLVAKPWGQLPPQADVKHRGLGGNLFSVGMAYAFSGKLQYAEWVRDGLVAYATFYSSLPLVQGRYRLFHHMLYESRWVGTVVQAYDMVAGSGAFTVEQARHVEEDLLRTGTKCVQIIDFEHDDRLKDLHFRCYNFQAWHIAAVGLAGLAIRDRDMVEWAVNSPYGYLHTIARDVRDDGMFWERSEGYHTFVIEGLLGFTEAMLHCGVDLYNISVPTDRMKDENENYLTDTSDRPKSFRMMFEPLFYMTFPDLSYPVLGDAGPGPIRASATFLVGSNRYRDPKVDWLVYRDRPETRSGGGGRGGRSGVEWQWLVYDVPANAPDVFPIQEGRFANTGEHRNGCTLFPATGLAILRQASGNYTTQPDSTAVSLSYGPHGGGHGHSNALNLV